MKNPLKKIPLKKVFSTKKRKAAGGVAALVIVALVANGLLGGKTEAATIPPSDFSKLTSTKLNATISYSGIVTTNNDINVYSTETYPVKEVRVKANDQVHAGDVLAVLDDTKLRQQIEQLEATAGVTAQNAAAQIRSARNRYNAAVRALNNNTNATLVSAQSGVEASRYQYEAAKKTYEDMLRSKNEGYNSATLPTDQAHATTELALKQAKLNYNQAVERLSKLKSDKSTADSDFSKYTKNRDNIQGEINSITQEIAQLQGMAGGDPSEVAAAMAAETAAKAALDNFLQANPTATTPTDPAHAQYQALLTDYTQKQQDTVNARSSNPNQTRINNLNARLSELQNQLADAAAKRQTAEATRQSYDSTKQSLEQAVEQAKVALEQAEEAARQGQQNKNAAGKNLNDAISTAKLSAETAKSAYDSAKQSLLAAQEASRTELQSYEDALVQAQAGANDGGTRAQLAALYETQQKMIIKAPSDGYVTAVNTEVGNMANGVLFTIKSLNDKVIEIDLKEIDMMDVKLGQKVDIKADGAGKMQYKGRIVSIAPVSDAQSGANSTAALAGAAGMSAGVSAGGSGGSANSGNTFKCKIEILNADGQLKPGMKAQTKILLAEEKGIYAVPFNALIDQKDKKASVFAAIPSKSGDKTYTLKKIKVTTGLENDVSVVIESNDLKDKMLILTNPSDHTDGETVLIAEADQKK